MKLKNKVIVITGSTRGIGLAIAQACAEEGAKVVICSRNKTAVDTTVETLNQKGFETSGIACNVSNQKDLEELLQHAIEKWERVDVWVNNAGLSGGYRPLDEMSYEEIADIVDVNLTGLTKACRLVIPYFTEQGWGILINMSGKGGRGDPSPFTAIYASTKAAVTSLTKSLAKENKANSISIHSLIPGMVKTDFYKDLKTSPKLKESTESLPYVFNAFGVPAGDVGRFFVKLAAQEPGKLTGKTYSLLTGPRLIRAIGLMIWYRVTGKIKPVP